MRKIIFSIIFLVFALTLSLAAIIFYRPTWIVNPKNLHWVLTKTKVLKSFSWKDAQINHTWDKWNKRRLDGYFKDLCFEFENEKIDIKTCLETVSWDFLAIYENGEFGEKTYSPFVIRSPQTLVKMKPSPEEEDSGNPPDLYSYWRMFWGNVIPDMDIVFSKITVDKDEFDFKLMKREKTAHLSALDFKLEANPKEFTLTPPKKYPLPKKIAGFPQFYLRDFILKGIMKPKGATLVLDGHLETIQVHGESFIRFPLREDLSSLAFKKKTLLETTVMVKLVSLSDSLKQMGPPPYTSLPAPLNAMDGFIQIDVKALEAPHEWIKFAIMTEIDLEGKNQALKLKMSSDVEVNLKDFTLGSVLLGLDFERLALEMPRLSKKEIPPQLIPDSRIKKEAFKKVKPRPLKERHPDLNFRLHALNEKAVHISTNLLDEPVRLNFDITVAKGKIQQGFISLLPLKTSVFKRKIEIPHLKITYAPNVEPVIESTIVFKLPEYSITLNLEGPLDAPRHSLTSSPPLPLNDIYAVLLFGRPMSDLSTDDKTAAQKTNHMVSQGILSLAVLYYFAGSPIQYIGYDPNTSNVTAQFGLGKKNSLYVTGSGQNVNATGVRRSLGKGWYLDTSVQNQAGVTNSEARNYGVLLERIIAY